MANVHTLIDNLTTLTVHHDQIVSIGYDWDSVGWLTYSVDRELAETSMGSRKGQASCLFGALAETFGTAPSDHDSLVEAILSLGECYFLVIVAGERVWKTYIARSPVLSRRSGICIEHAYMNDALTSCAKHVARERGVMVGTEVEKHSGELLVVDAEEKTPEIDEETAGVLELLYVESVTG